MRRLPMHPKNNTPDYAIEAWEKREQNGR